MIRGFDETFSRSVFVCTLAVGLSLPGWSGIGSSDDCGDIPFSSPCVIQESQISTRTFIGGNIEEPGDLDVFQFHVGSEHLGFLYLIETVIPDGDPFSDTYVRLIDPDGISEIVADNDSGTGAGSKILWVPLTEGDFFVEVSQFFPDEIGIYQISVFRVGLTPPDDHGNDWQTATEVLVGGAPLSGSTELSADRDYFKFSIDPNRFYDIETSGLEAGSDTVMTLYSEDGVTPLETDDQGGREFNASRIVLISPDPLPAGDLFYYLEIQQFLTGTSGVGYNLSVESKGSPALLAMEGQKTLGAIAHAGEIDAYIFSASEMSTFSAHLEAATGELNLFEMRLLDRDGVSVLESQKNLEFEDLEYTIDEVGDYFLLVTEEYEGGAYTLSATSELSEGDPDLNLDGNIDHKDFILLMEAYRSDESP